MIITPKNWHTFQHYKDRSPSWIKLHKCLLDDYDFCCLPIPSRALAPFLWLLASEYEDGRIGMSLDALAFRMRMTRGDFANALNPLLEAGFFTADDSDHQKPSDTTMSLAKRVAKSNGYSSRYITETVKKEAWDRDGGECCSCGSAENIEYDHKIPVSKGGSSDLDNIQLLCRRCNRKKRASTSEPAEQVATQVQSLRSLEKEDIEKKEEVEEEKKETREVALSSVDSGFDEFWLVWPHKVGKPAALKAFNAAVKRAALADIVAGVRNYIRDKPPDRSWLNPATFLNQNRWEDQPASIGAPNAKPGNVSAACVDLVNLVKRGFGEPTPQDDFGGRADEADARLLSYRGS